MPWIHCTEYVFFIIQGLWATCGCPEKQRCPGIFHCIEIFLSFKIFEQPALALKTEFALKFFKPGVPDDSSRTIKCRIAKDTTGASLMVTDDYIARYTVAAVRVSQKRFYNFLVEFPSITGCLDLKTPCKHPFEHHTPATCRHCFARAQKAALKHAALARQKIYDMLASGVLEPASGPYASLMHIVPKDGGKDIGNVVDFPCPEPIYCEWHISNTTLSWVSKQDERCK